MTNTTDRIHLVFDSKTLDYIANVLGKQPYIEVAVVLQNIGTQVKQQQSKGPLAGPLEGGNGSGATEASPTH